MNQDTKRLTRFSVITLFPDIIESYLACGVVGRANERGIIGVDTYNPRDYTANDRRNVDDVAYGGGPGMVMQVEPLRNTINSAKGALVKNGNGDQDILTICLSPQGEPLTQPLVAEFAHSDNTIIVAGRYEGIDDRVLSHDIDREVDLQLMFDQALDE